MFEEEFLDPYRVGSGTDPMELAAAVFEYDHENHGPMPVSDLRDRFPSLPRGTFDTLLAAARDEGLVRVQRRFGQTGLIHPLRLV
jgi:hypothetical protein